MFDVNTAVAAQLGDAPTMSLGHLDFDGRYTPLTAETTFPGINADLEFRVTSSGVAHVARLTNTQTGKTWLVDFNYAQAAAGDTITFAGGLTVQNV